MALQVEHELLTVEDAMQSLRVSRSTLYRLIGSGQLTGHKVGRTWRFYCQEVQACIQKPSVPGGQEETSPGTGTRLPVDFVKGCKHVPSI